MAAFAIIAGAFQYFRTTQAAAPFMAYPPHHSTCTLNVASKNPVLTGETFTATVSMYNDGLSTYDPGYAVYLSEYNGGEQTNIWNVRGNSLAGRVEPGSTAVFHLTVTAPSTPGTYEFDWAMSAVYNGVMHNPCAGGSITVNAPAPPPPPPQPVINSFTANPTNVSSGGTSTLSWSSSNATACSISPGLASGGTSGSWKTPALTSSTSYTLACASSAGQVYRSLSVTVNKAPPPSAPPPSSPLPSNPSTPSKPSAAPVQNPAYKAPTAASTYTPPNGQAAVTDQPSALGTYGAAFVVEPAGATKVNIIYGTDDNVSQHTDQVITNGKPTSVVIQQLQPATTYYFQVERYNAAGVATKGSMGQFTTKGFNVVVNYSSKKGASLAGIKTSIPELQLNGSSDSSGVVFFSEVTSGRYVLHYEVNGVDHQQDLDLTAGPVADPDPTQPTTAVTNVGIDLDAVGAKSAKKSGGVGVIILLVILLLAAAAAGAWWYFIYRQRLPRSAMATPEHIKVDHKPSHSPAPPTYQTAPHAGESLKDLVVQGMREEAERRRNQKPPS